MVGAEDSVEVGRIDRRAVASSQFRVAEGDLQNLLWTWLTNSSERP